MQWFRYMLIPAVIFSFSVAGSGCNSEKKPEGTSVNEELAMAKERSRNRKKREDEKAKSGGQTTRNPLVSRPPSEKQKTREELEAEYQLQIKARRDKVDGAQQKYERQTRIRNATPRELVNINAEDRPKKELRRPDLDAANQFSRNKSYKNRLAVNVDRRKFYGLGARHLKENSDLPENTKRQAIDLCNEVFENQFPVINDRPQQWEELHRRADALISAKCSEQPMVLLVGSIAATGAGEHVDAFNWINKSIEQFHKSTYPDRMYVFARGWSMQISDNHELTVDAKETIKFGISACFNWLALDMRAEPDEYRFVYEVLDMYFDYVARSSYSVAEQQKLIIDAKIAPPWIQEILEMEFWSRQAWSARGGGYANTVSKQGWRIFREYNQRADKIARKAYEMNPAFPRAAAELISLAYLGFDDESPRYWMKKTQEAQFDYPPIFNSYLNFTQPQWGGDAEEQLEFGLDCYETNRFDTDVPFFLIRVLGQLVTRFNDDEGSKLLADPRVYPAMRDCLNQYIEHRPASQRAYYLSFRSVLSRQLGHIEDAVDDMIELGEVVHEDALKLVGTGRSSEYWSGMTLAYESEHRTTTEKLLGLVGQGWDRESRKRNAEKFRDLVAEGLESNMDPLEKAWFEHFTTVVDNEERYFAGDWVDWEFVQGVPEWTGTGHHCFDVQDDGTLMMDSMKVARPTNMTLRPEHELPGPKTMEAEIEVFNPSMQGQFEAGFQFVTFGYPERSCSVALTTYPKGLRASAALLQTVFAVNNSNTGKRKLRVNITEGYLEVFLDDQFVMAMNGKEIEPGNLILLGQRLGNKSRGKVSYHNLRVRQWDMNACPLVLDQQGAYDKDKVIEWFKMAQQLDLDQPYYAWRIALAHFNAGEYSEAADFAGKARELGMPASRTGLLDGFVHDIAGNYEKALEFYSSDDGQEFYQLEYFNPRARMQQIMTPEVISSAWKAWLVTTSGDRDIDADEIQLTREIERSNNWVFRRILAARRAYTGDFRSAASTLKSTLQSQGQIPELMQKEIREQMAAYEAEKLWLRDKDGKSFYHKFKIHVGPSVLEGGIKFIRH